MPPFYRCCHILWHLWGLRALPVLLLLCPVPGILMHYRVLPECPLPVYPCLRLLNEWKRPVRRKIVWVRLTRHSTKTRRHVEYLFRWGRHGTDDRWNVSRHLLELFRDMQLCWAIRRLRLLFQLHLPKAHSAGCTVSWLLVKYSILFHVRPSVTLRWIQAIPDDPYKAGSL